jgi:hypothetical protein
VTRLGRKAPMCKHVEAEPGPPFQRKITGDFWFFYLLF